MILALNRLQPLSGNKYFYLIFVCILLASSCVSKKKVVKTPTKPKPSTNTNTPSNEGTKKVEEVQWTFADENDHPPIGSKKVITTATKEQYNIALLIPFNARTATGNKLIEKGTIENRFIQFYTGMKMAFDEYSGSSSMQIDVYDSSDGAMSTNTLSQADVIIGPYDKTKIKNAALVAKENDAVLISPWQASKRIAQKNPNYVQLKPNLEDHYYAIAEDALDHFSTENVYLLGREKTTDKARFKYFQEFAANYKSREAFQELLISDDSLKYGETVFDSTLFEKDIALIIPNWKSADESFVYSCMRRLRVEKSTQKVTVYGMPIMAESDKMNYDLYLNLNATVAQSRFFDKNNSFVKQFRSRYFNLYNTLPGKDACEGYDIGKYVLKNLDAYGKSFQFFLEEDQSQYLISSFNVSRYLVDPEEDPNDKKNIEYFLNNKVQIIHFNQGTFTIK